MGVVSMASEATKLKQIDWRRKPLSDDESRMATGAFIKAQRFLTSMKSIADRYASGEAKIRLRETIVPIILNTWDGYLSDSVIAIDQNDETAAFAKTLGVDWGYLSNAIDALFSEGVLAYTHSANPEKPRSPNYVVCAADGLHENLGGLKGQVLNHSRVLDVHTWSDHPEVNAFVNQIWDAHFGGGNKKIRKKHIKVVLLDLYVQWCNDPALKIGVSLHKNHYKAKTRYNALHISYLTVEIIDILEDAGLIHQAPGVFGRAIALKNRTARIWPTPKLMTMFQDAKFSVLDIGPPLDAEVIILNQPDPERPGKKVLVEYEDTDEIRRMRDVVQQYNQLIHGTFIDIPTVVRPGESSGFEDEYDVDHNDKFTRRIFNRGSTAFDKGGRFYGGWWQQCPADLRERIFIDDEPVSEIDYSGLHIVILYANEEIDYWEEIGTDPYTIPLLNFMGDTSSQRALCKELLLIALNAKDERKTYQAFRANAPTGSLYRHMTDDELGEILSALKDRHSPIAHKIANDAGIDLMNQDSRMAEIVIEHFTDQGIPVLAIHDSFLVPMGLESELEDVMRHAFNKVTGNKNVRLKEATHDPSLWDPLDLDDAHQVSASSVEEAIEWRKNPVRSERYLRDYDRFKEWIAGQQEDATTEVEKEDA